MTALASSSPHRCLIAALATVLALSGAGCSEGDGIDNGSAAIRRGSGAAQGPDAHGGRGNTVVRAPSSPAETVPNDDFVLENDEIRINIDAVGMDPASDFNPLVPAAPAGTDGVPIQTLFAPSGGNLIDIEIRDAGNDQFLQAGQSVVGVTSTAGLAANLNNPLQNFVFYYDVIPDGGPEYEAFLTDDDPLNAALVASLTQNKIVTANENMRRIICRGVITNFGGAANNILGTITIQASQASSAFGPGAESAFQVNVPDELPVVAVDASGGTLGDGGILVPVPVTTVYSLGSQSRIFSIFTVVGNPDPAQTVGIAQVVDLVLTGSFAPKYNLDVMAAGPTFSVTLPFTGSPPLLTQTELLQEGGSLQVDPGQLPAIAAAVLGGAPDVNGNGVPDTIEASVLPRSSRGAQTWGLGAAPYVTFVGRDEPGVSYTFFDPNVGQIAVNRQLDVATALIQVRGSRSIDDPCTPARESSIAHLRFVAVGTRNDVASSANLALEPVSNQGEALGEQPRPVLIAHTAVVHGKVEGAPPGTIVSLHEVGVDDLSPAVFFSGISPFSGNTLFSADPTQVGIFGPQAFERTAPCTTTLVTPSPAVPEAVVDEIMRTTVRVNDDGEWSARVPVGASVHFPLGSTSVEFETSRYVAKIHLPGGRFDAPIELDERTVRAGDRVDFGTFNARSDASGLGYVELEVIDSATGRRIPAQINVIPSNGFGVPLTSGEVATAFGPLGFDIGGRTALGPFTLERARGVGGFRPGAPGPGVGGASFGHTASGKERIPLLAGQSYIVIASRGTEWEADREEVTIAAGETERVTLELAQVVDPDQISLDGHVHSGDSLDSSLPLADRVRSFLGAGVEVLCSTEHNKIADIQGAIDAVAAEQPAIRSLLKGLNGTEATANLPGWPVVPEGTGHYTAFPLPFDKTLRKRGAPESEFRSQAAMVASLRNIDPDADEIVNFAHPRSTLFVPGLLANLGYFHSLGGLEGFGVSQATFPPSAFAVDPPGPFPKLTDGSIDPNDFGDPLDGLSFDGINLMLKGQGLLAPALFPLIRGFDYDTIEVMTGNGNALEYIQVRRDWFDLLNRGIVKTAMGNSDTHVLSPLDGYPAGYPRNYLLIDGVEPDTVTDADIIDALRPRFALPAAVNDSIPYADPQPGRMASYATTGPVITSLVVSTTSASGSLPTSGTIGEVVGTTAATVSLTCTIGGPDFILAEVDSAVIWVYGVPVVTVTSFTAGTNTLSFTVPTVPVDPVGTGRDSWIVVEIGRGYANDATFQPDPGAGLIYGAVTANGFLACITNPIFIDADDDADEWTPPGLDVRPSAGARGVVSDFN